MTTSEATLTENLPIEQVEPNPRNLRHRIGDLSDLTRSVEAVGIIEPLLVTPNDHGTYTVVAGHRRLAAAQAAGVTNLLCVVRAISDIEAVELTLIENGQRHDLNAIEEAEGYYQLFEAGRTVTAMATTLGRSAKHISARLALLELPKKARRAIERNKISLSDAEALLTAREHPDLIEATIESLDSEDGGSFDVRRSIENALREHRRDESVAALRTQAEERGLRRVEYEGYQPTSYRSLREGLGLDADARRQHRREACHAVTVEARWDGRAELVEVCTDWRRHTTRGKGNNSSAVQVASHTDGSGAERERQAARRSWSRRRAEFMTTALAGRVAKATITDAALHTLIEEAGANASRRAAQLLGIDADTEHGYQDWHRVLVEHARQNPPTLIKTAVAVIAAHGEDQLRGGYRQPDTYRALLGGLGYEPDDGEFPASDGQVIEVPSDPPPADDT